MQTTKVYLLYLLSSTACSEVFSSVSDKAKLFAKKFSINSNLGDLGISLPFFPSRTNLKLHNISLIPNMVKKIVTNLDSSKASSPDCIQVVVLKNCEPDLSLKDIICGASYILKRYSKANNKYMTLYLKNWSSVYIIYIPRQK